MTIMRKTILLATTAMVAAVALVATAEAGGRTASDSRDAEIQELKARLDRLESQQAEEQRAEQDAAVQEQTRLLKLEKNTFAFNANGTPTFSSADGAFTLSLKSRIHFDVIDYFQDPSDQFAATPGPVRDLSNGTNFRRMYFGVAGKFFKDFEYEIRLSFGGSGLENAGCTTTSGGANKIAGCGWINLARVYYTGIPNFKIGGGAIEPIFTLQDSTSSGDLTFMERASVVTALIGTFGGDDSREGVEATFEKQNSLWVGDNVLISAAYTGTRTGQNHDGDPASGASNDEGTQVLGRIADRVYSDPDTNIQVGASAARVLGFTQQGNTPGFTANASYSDFPELRMDAEKLVSTGNIAADDATMYGFEGAAQWKFLYLAGEYYHWSVDRHASTLDPDFKGYYVEGAWVLTGESKAYNAGKAAWGGVRPDNNFDPIGGTGWGAFELAARYSVLDLNWNEGVAGFATPAGGIRGGEQTITTVGMNWYLNPILKLQMEYEWVKVDRLSGAGAQAGQDLNILGTRMALNF
jgi:phosphate-selective porin OprO/OprP